MISPEEKLRRELKQLILLLKKMKERDTSLDFLSEHEQMMLKNMDFVIKNFENTEIMIPSDFTGEMAESFGAMIHELVNALQEELGEDGIYLSDDEQQLFDIHDDDMQKIDKSLPVLTVPELMKSIDAEIPMKHRLMMAIQSVDERLKVPDLNTTIVDELLDRRIELLEELRKYS